ncbi:PREDICTED: huntingtin-like, partial [Rhagoletis zephyria]|uniref:huntingtin-like n=1 Tax=Rhagoletis zephyria TaxID=28612 RepID=UPI0008118EE5
AMQCSDTHTKLVWTLNYCLIEWTSKFVPQCHLLSNTVIAAGNFLRKTSNEDVYLCVLHGLERIVVISNVSHSSGGPAVNTATGISGIVTPVLRNKIEKLALELVKLENERFSIPALQLLLSCMYVGSAKQLENTELSNGIVQDEPEIIAQQTDKVDILLHCIKSSTRDAAWIYGQVLCQIIRDLVPPNEILTKVIKEFLAINQPHCDVIAMIVYQVFRCAIDSTFLQMLQDWLICSLPTFLALPEQKGVWCLSVIFLSASINLHLIKLFPVLLSTGAAAVAAAAAAAADSSTATGGIIGGCDVGDAGEVGGGAGVIGGASHKLGQHEIALFVTAAVDFHAKLSAEQRMRFRDAFEKFHKQPVYAKLLQSI